MAYNKPTKMPDTHAGSGVIQDYDHKDWPRTIHGIHDFIADADLVAGPDELYDPTRAVALASA